MGSFLTGKKGTTGSQMDQLQQEIDVPMAPRPSGRPKGGRKVTSKKAAKKTCAPGYAVYNYRKTRKGVFYDCAPKRKTRRSRK